MIRQSVILETIPYSFINLFCIKEYSFSSINFLVKSCFNIANCIVYRSNFFVSISFSPFITAKESCRWLSGEQPHWYLTIFSDRSSLSGSILATKFPHSARSMIFLRSYPSSNSLFVYKPKLYVTMSQSEN